MDKDIRKAEERLEYLSSDKKTIELYRAREKALHERANMISSAKEAGREEGREEGRKRQSKEIAITMLKMGIDADIVCKATGLDKDIVEQLRSSVLN